MLNSSSVPSLPAIDKDKGEQKTPFDWNAGFQRKIRRSESAGKIGKSELANLGRNLAARCQTWIQDDHYEVPKNNYDPLAVFCNMEGVTYSSGADNKKPTHGYISNGGVKQPYVTTFGRLTLTEAGQFDLLKSLKIQERRKGKGGGKGKGKPCFLEPLTFEDTDNKDL